MIPEAVVQIQEYISGGMFPEVPKPHPKPMANTEEKCNGALSQSLRTPYMSSVTSPRIQRTLSRSTEGEASPQYGSRRAQSPANSNLNSVSASLATIGDINSSDKGELSHSNRSLDRSVFSRSISFQHLHRHEGAQNCMSVVNTSSSHLIHRFMLAAHL